MKADYVPDWLVAENWDQLVTSYGGHFLQSSSWRQFQVALGREVVTMDGAGWAWQAVIMSAKGFRYMYAPYGPAVQTDLQTAVDKLRAVAGERQVRADFIRLEPTGQVTSEQLQLLGARRAAPVQPSQTQVIDLTQDQEQIRAGLSSGHRNAINGAERRGLSFRTSDDPTEIETFITMLKSTTARAGIRPHPDHYYQTMAQVIMPTGEMKLHLAERNGRPVAAAIGLEWQGVDYYAHAAAHPEARQLQAAVPLVWFMMMRAKQAGQKQFDLYGIAPTDDPSHPWAGFTRFKQAFGGQRQDYVGTWEIPIKQTKYRLFRLAKKVAR